MSSSAPRDELSCGNWVLLPCAPYTCCLACIWVLIPACLLPSAANVVRSSFALGGKVGKEQICPRGPICWAAIGLWRVKARPAAREHRVVSLALLLKLTRRRRREDSLSPLRISCYLSPSWLPVCTARFRLRFCLSLPVAVGAWFRFRRCVLAVTSRLLGCPCAPRGFACASA